MQEAQSASGRHGLQGNLHCTSLHRCCSTPRHDPCPRPQAARLRCRAARLHPAALAAQGVPLARRQRREGGMDVRRSRWDGRVHDAGAVPLATSHSNECSRSAVTHVRSRAGGCGGPVAGDRTRRMLRAAGAQRSWQDDQHSVRGGHAQQWESRCWADCLPSRRVGARAASHCTPALTPPPPTPPPPSRPCPPPLCSIMEGFMQATSGQVGGCLLLSSAQPGLPSPFPPRLPQPGRRRRHSLARRARRRCSHSHNLPPPVGYNKNPISLPICLQAIIEGHDIGADMGSVYSLMGACPQHDLLWDGLTGAPLPPHFCHSALAAARCPIQRRIPPVTSLLPCSCHSSLACTYCPHVPPACITLAPPHVRCRPGAPAVLCPRQKPAALAPARGGGGGAAGREPARGGR